MTDAQLLALDLALKQILETNPTTRSELLSWTLTLLVKQGDSVAMKTVWLPAKEQT